MTHTPSSNEEQPWCLVTLDPNAEFWYLSAVLAFCVNHHQALGSIGSHQEMPEDLHVSYQEFREWGWELGTLEHDLAQTLNEFKTGYQVLYDDPDRLYLKKFSVVYHSDNFFVRVHKLKDNVYTLVGKMVGVEQEYKERAFFKQVFERLEASTLHAVAKCLHTFEADKAVKEALRQRKLFVHRYRREPEWPMMDAGQRFYETGEYGDSLGNEIRAIDQVADLDRYADRKADELLAVLEGIRRFRDALLTSLADSLLPLAPTLGRFQRDVLRYSLMRLEGELPESLNDANGRG